MHKLLLADSRCEYMRKNITCVKFGNRGDKLVASYHGDHAYAFDLCQSTFNRTPVSYRTHLAAQQASVRLDKHAKVSESTR